MDTLTDQMRELEQEQVHRQPEQMPEEVKERLMGRLRSIEKAKKGGYDEGMDYHEEEIRMAK